MKTKIILLVMATAILGFWSCTESIETTPELSNDEALLKSAQIAENDLLTESILEEVNFEAGIFTEYEKMLRQLANYKLNETQEVLKYIPMQFPLPRWFLLKLSFK